MQKKTGRGFRIYIALLAALLLGAIALLAYALAANGVTKPSLPGGGRFAQTAVMGHG